MESNRFLNSGNDDQQRAFDGLLDAFGSVFSLEVVADAYYKAGKNPALAGAMLYNMQERTSNSSDFTTRSENSSELSHEILPCRENEGYKALKAKRQPASMGTVSSVLGKSYWRPKTMGTRTDVANKPLKIELPMSDISGKESGFTKDDDGLHLDVEGFLVKMLGEGFKFDRGTIHEVLGSCGYDMEKSVEKILDLSATTMDKRDNIHFQSSKKTDGLQRQVTQKEKSDVQKEVLTSLFSVPEWSESSSEVTSRVSALKRSSPFGHLVVEPLRDVPPEHSTQTSNVQPEIEQDKEDSYNVIRKAVLEYRVMTKEYFKSAVEAFVNGDRDQADKLLEQGLFFQRKARETDEESVQMIFDSGDEDVHETMPLDLHDMDPKEALRLLKHHLSSLSGIPSLTFLKVIMEREEDTSKGARKRMVLRLLEKESLKWTEEGGDSGTIIIRLDEINRKKMRFVKR